MAKSNLDWDASPAEKGVTSMNQAGSGSIMHVDLWGPLAAFTPPEFRTEQFTYPVITPSAARNIIKSIYWHPPFEVEIRRITVYNEIKMMTMARNECKAGLPAPSIARTMQEAARGEESAALMKEIGSDRQIRSSTYLTDVWYGIDFAIVPNQEINKENGYHAGEEFNLTKYREIYRKRLSQGRAFRSPYFGKRECSPVYFAERRKPGEEPKSFYDGQIMPLGPMRFDSTYTRDADGTVHERDRIVFMPIMRNGVIDIDINRQEVAEK